MVEQYPYTLKVFREAESVYNQQAGEWTQGDAEWIILGNCRDEINGSGARVTTQDGENYTYSAVVYAPLSTNSVGQGAKIAVFDGETKRMEGNVVRFSKGQLNVRIWV